MPRSPVVITTVVTTNLVTRIGHHFGAQVVNNLLSASRTWPRCYGNWKRPGSSRTCNAPEDLILATEESHGIMAMPQIRDKDAAAACLLLAELALDESGTVGRCWIAACDRAAIWYFRNEVLNIAMTGIEGRLLMTRMMESPWRANPPREMPA